MCWLVPEKGFRKRNLKDLGTELKGLQDVECVLWSSFENVIWELKIVKGTEIQWLNLLTPDGCQPSRARIDDPPNSDLSVVEILQAKV